MYNDKLEKYGKNERFIVYSASAGTGKTHNITKRELIHLFEKGSPNFISITFTNKAAKEMKERLVEYLLRMASSRDIRSLKDKDRAISDIIDTLKLESPQEAERILLTLLDNYSSLLMGTIDSFTVKLLRAYQDKTDYPLGFNVLIDSEEFETDILKDTINEIYKEVYQEDEEEFKDFFKELILLNVKDKINIDIFDKLLTFISNMNKLLIRNSLSISDLGDIPNKKLGEIKEIKNKLKNKVEILLGFGINDTIKKYLDKCMQYIEDDLTHFIEIKSPYKKGLPDDEKELEEFKNGFVEFECLLMRYKIYYSINKLSHILDLFKKYNQHMQKNKNSILEIPLTYIYSELSSIIQNGTEIAERLGKDIDLLLVDEFQDTSPEQINVIRNIFDYLLDNEKSDGEVVVVGDTKQAIYGFRGADYSALSELIARKKLSDSNSLISLKTNYRSKKELIKFVTNLFPKKDGIKGICEHLDFKKAEADKEIRHSYEKAFIETGLYNLGNINSREDEGYLEINSFGIDFEELIKNDGNGKQEFFGKDEIESIYPNVLKNIEDAKKRGYQYRDMCIIAHKNDIIIDVSHFLSQNSIPFKSFSTMDARERPISKEIISLMKYIQNEDNSISLYMFLQGEIFENFIRKNSSYKEEFSDFVGDFERNRDKHRLDRKSRLYKDIFESIFKKAKSMSAYDTLLEIYRVFGITEGAFASEQAAYMTLLNAALKIESSQDNTIQTFIEEFEKENADQDYETGDVWTMNISETIDAITLSTIHKVKGLEFPIVFYLYKREQGDTTYPYADIDIDGKRYILKTESEYFKFSDYLVADLKDISNKVSEHKKREYSDILNAHYVALTRAKDEMYLYIVNGGSKDGTKSILVAILYNYIKNNPNPQYLMDKSRFVYKIELGEKKPIETKKAGDDLPKYFLEPTTIPQSRNIYIQSFLNRDEQAEYGTQIHNVLSKIEFIDEDISETAIKNAIEEVRKDGIVISDTEEIRKDITAIIKNKDMKWIFDRKPERVIKNEVEFVDESGSLYRIDRLILDKENAYVIDYKSGKPTESERVEYRKQVKKYREIISKFYKKDTKGFLFFINKNEVEEV